MYRNIHSFRNLTQITMRSGYSGVILPVAFFTVVFFVFFLRASSQEFEFEKIESQGKSNFNFVTGITQTPKGLIWFTTKNGLYSYDGKSITGYNPNASNPNSLSSNALESIAADKSGNIWVGTLGEGLNRFDPHTKKFTDYKYETLMDIFRDFVFAIRKSPE